MKGMKKLAAAAVLTVVALSVVVAGGKTEQSSAKKSTEANKTIRIFGAFRGEEAARFDEIVKAFNAKTGYNVVYEGSPEFETQILVQAEAGTPPDIAALPQPGMMKNFASRGFIKPLSANVVSKIDENYAKVWKDLGSADGKVYGVFHRVNAKSFVWYPKKAFPQKAIQFRKPGMNWLLSRRRLRRAERLPGRSDLSLAELPAGLEQTGLKTLCCALPGLKSMING